jgi:DNA-binding MarR family transcriptional regulator
MNVTDTHIPAAGPLPGPPK